MTNFEFECRTYQQENDVLKLEKLWIVMRRLQKLPSFVSSCICYPSKNYQRHHTNFSIFSILYFFRQFLRQIWVPENEALGLISESLTQHRLQGSNKQSSFYANIVPTICENETPVLYCKGSNNGPAGTSAGKNLLWLVGGSKFEEEKNCR